MHIIIKDKHPGTRGRTTRISAREIQSRVTTHEGEIISGSKAEKYREKYIINKKYKEPIKWGQGNWQ